MKWFKKWQPIETIFMDGRQVEFKSPAGKFIAPALSAKPVTKIDALAIYNSDGSLPNVKYTATHWRDI